MERTAIETPVSNTGVKRTKPLEIGIDWLAGTFPDEQWDDVLGIVQEWLGEEFYPQVGGIGFYAQSWRSPTGAVMGRSPKAGENRNHAYVSLTGSVLARFDALQVVGLISRLHYFGFRGSRVDVKADDHEKIVTPERVYEASLGGNYSGFRSGREIHSFGSKANLGRTVEFGRRGKTGSGKFLRVYDKCAESGGKIDAIRIELELSGKMARGVVEYLAMCPDMDAACLGAMLHGIITGCIDFVQRDASGRKDRAVRYDWWESFAGDVVPVKLSSGVVKKTLEGLKTYFKKAWAPLVVTFMNAFPTIEDWNEWWMGIVMDGESRMQDRHYALMNAEKMLSLMQT